jgi:cytochrome c553
MLRRRPVLPLVALFLALLPSYTLAAARETRQEMIERGKILTFACIGCHGIRGYNIPYPSYNVPKVAGQNRAYLLAALEDYRDGLREFPTMVAETRSMTNHELKEIAYYFASLRGHVKTRTPIYSRSEAKRGAKLVSTCAACHGLHGIAVAPEFPDLAGQYPSYLERALEEYKHGLRKNAIMNGMAASLTHREIVEIANYFASQKGPLGQIPGA